MKTVDFRGLKVRLDRPKGFIQEGKDSSGKPWRRQYKLDYGYLPRTAGGDGEHLDVFLGPDKASNTTYWAVQQKPDGSFDEYKVFLGFSSRPAAQKAYGDHIPMKLMKTIIPVPFPMMQAMLGVEPAEKLAQAVACLDELAKIESRA